MVSGAALRPCLTSRALITTTRELEVGPCRAPRLAARPLPKAPPRLPRPPPRYSPPAFCVAARTRATKLFPLTGILERMRPGRMLILSPNVDPLVVTRHGRRRTR